MTFEFQPTLGVAAHGNKARRRNLRNGQLRLLCAFALLGMVGASTRGQVPASRPAAPDSPPTVGANEPNLNAAAGDKPAGDLMDDFADMGDADLKLLEMDVPVVITAGRRKQSLAALPYAVTVVTAEDIRRAGARSIPDALRLVPGMDVADLTYSNYAVSPRGFHGFVSRQVLVLVDGRQIFDGLFGGTVWGAWPFMVEDIERIEVVRGPSGLTWGANAVNGVINIITKDPRDQQGLTLIGGGGSRGTYKQYAGYGYADDRLRFRISQELEGSDGFAHGGSILGNVDDYYHGVRMSLYGVLEASPDDTITISGASSVVDGGFARTPLAGLRTRRPDSQSNYVVGNWLHRVADDNSYQVTGFVNDYHAAPGTRQIDYRYQQFALQFSHTFVPAEHHTLTWGVDTRLDLLDPSNSDPYMLTRSYVRSGIVGAYAQDDWRFAPKWQLSFGGRIDYETYGGFEPSARVALSYDLTESQFLYGSVSRAFQMPPPPLRFLNIPMAGGLARVTSHEDLPSLSLIAYELGYRGRYFDRLRVAASLFWHEYFDLSPLSPRPGPPALLRLDLHKDGSATLYGAELEAELEITPKLSLLGNYTYEHFDLDASAAIQDLDNVEPPHHKFMVGTRYDPLDDLHLSAQLYYVDDTRAADPINPFHARRIEEYFRLDLLAEYEFFEKHAALSVGVKNLLDPNHYEGGTAFLNNAETPRMIYGQLRISFD